MKYFKFSLFFVASLFLVTACNDDPEEPMTSTESPISSFQFEIDENDFLTVNFSNFSQNATSYAWDFGDGNTSTEEAPSHSYAGGGDFTVSLEAINGSESRTSMKTVTITDPNTEVTKIHGGSSKVWKLSRNTEAADAEFACLVGPENRSEIWWSYGGVSPLTDRLCMTEEEYIFGSDGSFTYDDKGMIWGEGGIWPDELVGCVDSTNPDNLVSATGDDLSGWAAGSFTFEFDSANGTLTLIGNGAHVGIAKVGTNAEFSTPQPSVTYKIVKLETDGPIDKMSLETTIDGGYWQMNLVSYDDPSLEPTLEPAGPVAAFSATVDGSSVTFENFSTNSDSYSWDFGDGNTSSESDPVHTYSSDGSYNVVLTATGPNGVNETSQSVIISNNSTFSASTMFGDDSKVWKLNPSASALAVGPTLGSGEWWSSSSDDITTRACTFDDEYTFGSDGTFIYDGTGEVWAEGYMGVDADGCIAEDALPETSSAWASGEHTYTVEVGENGEPSFVTVTGTGAFIGLPKAYNGGEYTAGPPPEGGSVKYQVVSYVNGADSEVIQLAVDFSENQDGTGWWTFTLFSE